MTDLLRGLAQLAAQAIANARVHAALDDGAARLRQINDAGIELAANLDLGRVLETAARRLCDVAGVDSCDVYTLDGQGAPLRREPRARRAGHRLARQPPAPRRLARLASRRGIAIGGARGCAREDDRRAICSPRSLAGPSATEG